MPWADGLADTPHCGQEQAEFVDPLHPGAQADHLGLDQFEEMTWVAAVGAQEFTFPVFEKLGDR